MKNVFVETENSARFFAALSVLERRGAKECCLLAVDGRPGLGKTTMLYRWAVQNGAIYLRAKKEWSPTWLLADLLGECGIAPAHTYKKQFAQALEALLARQNTLALERRSLAIVLDEADHFSRNERIMETIRDLSDLTNVVFVLIGMGKLRDNLARFPQIASRIAKPVQFELCSINDVKKFFAEKSDIPASDCLIAFVHRVTGGYNREILEAISRIERFGKRNGAGPDRPVTLADMAGQEIITDRRTGQSLYVPEAV